MVVSRILANQARGRWGSGIAGMQKISQERSNTLAVKRSRVDVKSCRKIAFKCSTFIPTTGAAHLFLELSARTEARRVEAP